MIYKTIICVLENCLVSNISGNKFPCGIWDWKVVWPVWNAFKYNKPENFLIISNNDCIKKGVVQNDSYWSKICFIAHCLRDYTKLNYVEYSYAKDADWKDPNGNNLGIEYVSKGKTLFVGVDDSDKEYAKTLGDNVDYININQLIQLSNEKRTNELFQRGRLPGTTEGNQ